MATHDFPLQWGLRFKVGVCHAKNTYLKHDLLLNRIIWVLYSLWLASRAPEETLVSWCLIEVLIERLIFFTQYYCALQDPHPAQSLLIVVYSSIDSRGKRFLPGLKVIPA